MKVSRIDIENHFEAPLLAEGEDLVRATSEYTIQQPDPTHYQVNATQPAYQVDITMLSGGMVNVKCYCTPFKRTKRCKHVVAALFLLRDYIQSRQKSNRHEKQETSATDEVLRKMKITDLRKFISAFADSHASFKAELLANTLHLTRKPDYASLLLDLTPIDKYGRLKLNRNNIKTLRGIISILLKQARQLFRDQALPETFQILEPTIHHLYRIIHKFPQYQVQLITELKTALQLFEMVCHQPMAPRLQQAAIKFAIDLSGRESYFFVKNTWPVLRVVEPFVLEKKQRQTILQVAEGKIKSDPEQFLFWSMLLIRWARVWSFPLNNKALLSQIRISMPEMISALNQQQDYEDLLFALHYWPDTFTDKAAQKMAFQLGLKAAILVSDQPEIIRLSRTLSQTFYDLDAWNVLHQENQTEAKKIIIYLQEHLVAGQQELADLLITHGFHTLQEDASLLERLQDLQDVSLMMDYDQSLLLKHRDAVIEFYAQYIRDMRETYGGAIARQKLNNIFSHLKSIDIYTAVGDKLKLMEVRKKDRTLHTGIEGFVFDLDGVIVDTAVHHFQSWKKIMAEQGIQIADEDDHHTRGASRMESLDFLLNKYKLKKSAPEKLELATRKNEYYLKAIEQITPGDLLPGVLQFLIDSRHIGLDLALGSASKNAKGVLKKLGISDLFDAILDGHDAEASKPDPEIFIKACQAIGREPDKVVVFEDAAKGVQAALAAGCHCVGLGDLSTLAAADMVIPDLASVSPQQIIDQFA